MSGSRLESGENRGIAQVPRGRGRRRHPRQERSRLTVDAILQATVELADTLGWDRTTTNRIAERAGVSIGSLYQYFSDKEAILAELVEQHHQAVHHVVWLALEELADSSRPVEQVLHSLMTGLVQVHREDPALTRAVTVAMPRPPAAKDDTGLFISALVPILRRRPDVAVRDPRLAAHVVAVAIEALTRWLVHDAPETLDPRAVVDEVVAMTAGYLAGAGPLPRR